MAYTIVQSYVSSSKYGLKCPYGMTPEGITVHNTANDAPARNEVSYMKNNNYEVSFHVAVDDKEVVIGIPFNRNAWHAGDGNGKGNRRTIGIEICYSKSGGSRFTAAEKNAAAYVAYLLKTYGWGINKVYTHQYWSGKNCPHRTLANGWQRFLDMVSAELAKLNGTVKTDSLYRVRKTWADSKSQLGAYKVLDNAKKKADQNKGYSVFDSKGTCVYPVTASAPATPAPAKKKSNVEIAKEVIAGKWGNGTDRKKKLEAAGYNYSAVQAEVNKQLSPSKKKSNTEIAKEVIAGKWGNGADRKKRLTDAGYDYYAIQEIVNSMI